MPKDNGSPRRRSAAPRKGDLREKAILDVTETLLATQGLESMTVSDIAQGAGLSRGSMYFYFGSKQEVVIALVARTVEALREKSREAANDPRDPCEAIATAMHRTREIWLEHGLIMRVAIDQAASVPEIDALWAGTAELFIGAITTVLERAGIPSGAGPEGAAAQATVLCWMIERSFYHASKVSPVQLRDTAATCEHVWLRIAGVA
jgi:AcrR family transcriptional regulator